MKKITSFLFAAAALLCLMVYTTACTTTESPTLDLSGEWSVKLDSLDCGLTENWQGQIYDTSITFPGTTDDAKIGVANTLEPALEKPQLTYLTRLNSYIGAAWYSREVQIPENMAGKELFLNLERVLWDSQVWVDGEKVDGIQESLTTPHRFDLTQYLVAGEKHIITIRVDNRKRHDISNDMAHAYTDHTQIKWNGVIGEIEIEAKEVVRADAIQLYPNVDDNSVKAVVTIVNNSGSAQNLNLELSVASKSNGNGLGVEAKSILATKGISTVEMTYEMGDDYIRWSEFTPEIYVATVETTSNDIKSSVAADFGMRKIESVGNKMYINDAPLFLRGTLECCIFPLTGTPPMDHAGWEKVFSAAKDYGLNHLRFHSWCPPKAAFEVADEMGFYLHVELPVWVLTIGKDQGAVDFMYDEAYKIIAEYGNHPSFCMWSLGNELQGDMSVLATMVDVLKAKDARHLYTNTSFTFEKGHGVWAEPNDDFFITQWTKHGWVRGQGVFNQYSPSFDKDYTAQLKGADVPLITHEIGQYSVYPDLTEIEKYTGVLKPLNFIAVKNDLTNKGLIDKAPDYLMASGKLAEILYKEEIERALKTDGISGFQLLDLHDFPGQGTALVGLLNAFWESKGIVTGKEFREYCSPVVPLLRFAKATYTNDETFSAEIELCNYSDRVIKDETISWEILDGSKLVDKGQYKINEADFGYNGELGSINADLSGFDKATKLEVVLKINDSDFINRWNIWVYPAQQEVVWGDVKYTRNYDEAMAMLAKGEKVIFNPDWKTMKGIEGKFVPVFWSPVHFPKQAGTMGLLCDPSHKAFANFPTDMHTDWQWWDLNRNSTTMIVDELQGGAPIVEMVDNFTNNRRLASLYEGSIGGGKLVLSSIDLATSLESRIVAKQLLASLLEYMNSVDFAPAPLSNIESMEASFGTTKNVQESANSIY